MPETDSAADGTAGQLETMRPNPAWSADAYEDCRGQLPDFGAALEAAGVPDDRVHHYPVEKEADGSKTGPRVEEYRIELIPTIVVERDGEEVGRYVEDERAPIAVYLAELLTE